MQILGDGQVWPSGVSARTWDGRDASGRPAAAGLYLVRLVAGGRVRVAKIALLP